MIGAMGSLDVIRVRGATARELAACSSAWDRVEGADARLVVAVPRDAAAVLGAFQRRGDVTAEGPFYRRGSGGAAARVGSGSVWVQLALARPGALVACTADKLLNRYVRPLLRASTRVSGTPVSHFGRDWVSALHRPVALVAFAHDASSGRALFEAIVAVSEPFAVAERASFLGKSPVTLAEAAGRPLDPEAVADAIAQAYRAIASEARDVERAAPGGGAAPGERAAPGEGAEVADEPPWAALRDEAIGAVAAGPDRAGRLRVGGELMASRDAIARLEDELASLPASAGPDALGRLVDDALSTRGAVVFGVRSLTSIRDVIAAARAPAP